MADRVLFVGFGVPVRGREEMAVEAFGAAVGIYGRLQQEGRIESFDVVLLSPTPQLGGYFEVRGSAAQLAAVREDEEWQRSMIDAELSVDDLRVVDGFINEGIAQQMALYQEGVAKVPQRT